jgi:hypothetical protein
MENLPMMEGRLNHGYTIVGESHPASSEIRNNQTIIQEKNRQVLYAQKHEKARK